jgi:hypothetical protein
LTHQTLGVLDGAALPCAARLADPKARRVNATHVAHAYVNPLQRRIRPAPADTKLKNSLSVTDVTGGKETSPMWTSQVDSSDFQRALENSLRTTGLLSPVRRYGLYQPTADLTGLDQPMVGFNMTVTATVSYSLIERSSGREIFLRSIPTPYTAKMGDAFVGSERLKLANEGAVRKNIEDLIAERLKSRIQVSLK